MSDAFMQDREMLANLVAQAEGEGGDLLMIRAIIEEASMIGAERALTRVGLSDKDAEADVRALRDMLGGWRDAKKAARTAAVGWLVRLAVMLLLLGLAVRTDLLPMVWA
jgi:hypothetical protein